MPHSLVTWCCLSVLWIGLSTSQCWAQTPAPAVQTTFALPLADKTTAQAVLLPTANGQAYLVYATPKGQLGFYLLNPTSPTPTPDPVPPVPPQPTRPKIAVVENPLTTTLEQRQVLSTPSWRDQASKKHDFIGIIPSDVIEKGTSKPPASLVPFLDRASTHNLPWVILCDQTGTIIWEGQLPTSAAELSALITKYGG
jgi:hypothetical protein